MVVRSVKNKNACLFPSRAVSTPDAEEFILESVASVLLPVGRGKSPLFHNKYHLNDASVSYNCAKKCTSLTFISVCFKR